MIFTPLTKTELDAIIRKLIAEQFKNTDLEKLFTECINPQVAEIETVLSDLLGILDIDTSYGAQLDYTGRIINLERAGKDDDSYRTLLKLKAKALTSFGQPEILIEAVKVLYNATDVEYAGDYPAGIDILHDGSVGLFIQEALNLDDAAELLLDDGLDLDDYLVVNLPDTISEDILDSVIPSGVSITVANFP